MVCNNRFILWVSKAKAKGRNGVEKDLRDGNRYPTRENNSQIGMSLLD